MSTMRIAIRVDASTRIGTGHVMRCLALASALRERGARVTFLTREARDGGARAIAARRFPCVTLPAQSGFEESWLGASEGFDASSSADALAGLAPLDWVVVDHYGLGIAWERVARAHAERLFVIDDLADRPHLCELLLDTTWSPDGAPDRYAQLVPPRARRLLGPSYALLRPEFNRAERRVREGGVSRVVVFFGGADPHDLTGRTLDALASDPTLAALEVDVVAGAANPRAHALSERASERVHVHVDTPRIAEIFAGADLAVGAAGTASWERAWLGLPALVAALADNQRGVARALAAAGAAVELGWHEDLTPDVVRDALLRACADPAALRAMSERALAMMGDGPLGTARVVDALAGARAFA
ncbi:MAG TPA: UDP-2,4-diacetamido-2,4,6-trideoxy-beta-L-altropyranose hydrolase [Candidatus Baltobacteraceae bacterium]|nr:UDP-2,4-diacetamido-2,4,6-trideoxy-beta-L-altropyranose hydrolase [Candidatus Baltobacteraceae bacterium]